MKKHFLLLVLVSVICGGIFSSAHAQQAVSIPYNMSFEDAQATELANWHLNTGAASATCLDHWTVGTAVHSDGANALYVVDTADASVFVNQANMQFVYRDFRFPAGSYSVSFDWMNGGDAHAALYVGWVDAASSAAAAIAANDVSGAFPASLMANCSGALYGQTNWQQYSFSKNFNVSAQASTSKTYRFFVAWANDGSSPLAGTTFGACLDNFQIVDARAPKPSNIQVSAVTCDTVLLTWEGAAETYIVQYRKIGTNLWANASYSTSMGNSALIEGLAEGSYDFRVSGISHDDQNNVLQSAFVYYEGEYLVYCPDRHCFAFFDLDAPTVTCTHGETNSSVSHSNAFETVGKIDFGSESELSRHTVNWDKTATDPRTGDGLKLVPDNAMASVRLGNWDEDNEAEGISYRYTVDSAYSIILLSYAIVLQAPDHHTPEQQARFTLEILDENNNQIDELCGYVDFYADVNRPGWHVEGSGYGAVAWKDWSTIGMNLGPSFYGKTISIRLSTYDCTQSGHYGYAYFTLDCAGATIETVSCGENTSFSAAAPDGFAYVWTDENNNVVGTEQQLNLITTDNGTYTCRLTYLEEEDCFFDLQVVAKPQFPMADGKWVYDPKNCQNIVRFISTSYVQTRDQGIIENHYDRNLGGVEWDFGDGQKSFNNEVSHIFPASGGTFEVTLSTWLADGVGSCVDDTTFYLTMPAIGDAEKDTTISICDGNYVEFGGIKYATSGTYYNTDLSPAGCKIYRTLYLTVNEKHETVLEPVILCYGDTFCLSDTCYQSRDNGIFKPVFVNQYGCDSMVVANITYADPILPIADIVQMSDSVYEAQITLGGTGYTYYTINNGDPKSPSEDFVTDEPGIYLYSFYNEYGCVDTMSLYVKAPCLRDMIFQRWNDIVSLYNKDTEQGMANGSLEFVAYQWYENGLPIPGANSSYYYAPNGLTIGAEYSCDVTLPDQSVTKTCAYVARDEVNMPKQEKVTVTPTKLKQGDNFRVYAPEEGTVTYYTVLGAKLYTESLLQGNNDLSASSLDKGMYILSVEQSDGVHTFRISVQ